MIVYRYPNIELLDYQLMVPGKRLDGLLYSPLTNNIETL